MGSKSKSFTPKLRFPEFEDGPGWEEKRLGDLASLINERVGESECTPYTVTSGVGLVSQKDKFGRTIAGNSLKNYVLLRPNDFAYNKSATKSYPEGFIARYTGDERAAVPNSIFTCFRPKPDEIDPAYLDYLFVGNLHGRWLKKFITVGARAHGSLNVNDSDLLSVPVPIPSGEVSAAEQRKIAACLSSLDGWIAAEGRKLEALRAHRKGLMQQIFPREGETLPRFRFSEFRDAGEWAVAPLGEIFGTTAGGTPDRTKKEYWGGTIPWITTSLVDFSVIREAQEFITETGFENSAAKLFPKGTVLVAMYGQGTTRGKVAMLGIEATTNQACAAILPAVGFDPVFTFLSLSGRYDEMRSLSNAGGQENLSQGLIRELPFYYPNDLAEQQRIATFLSSLDTLIVAQSRKLGGLRAHKKGLMQQLFPSPEDAGA